MHFTVFFPFIVNANVSNFFYIYVEVYNHCYELTQSKKCELLSTVFEFQAENDMALFLRKLINKLKLWVPQYITFYENIKLNLTGLSGSQSLRSRTSEISDEK